MTKNYVGWGHRMPDYQLMAPFPYFGGKRNGAPAVWEALGDVGGYIEPFAGSAAVLLGRPPFEGQRVETINDTDGWLVNAWRAIQHDPSGVAKIAFGPTSEVDYHARYAWLAERRTPDLISWLEGDPEQYDTKAAGWWLYVMAIEFGDPFRGGPWHVEEGHLVRSKGTPNGIERRIPHVGGTGRGILRRQPESYGETAVERVETYLKRLQERMAHVRITVGDWKRIVTPTVWNLRTGPNSVGIFLDPPYKTGRQVYVGTNSKSIAQEVLDWCLTAPEHLRIVLAGYNDDNDELLKHGWTKEHSIGGQGSGFSDNPDNGRRERLWFSPACLNNENTLFDLLEKDHG